MLGTTAFFVKALMQLQLIASKNSWLKPLCDAVATRADEHSVKSQMLHPDAVIQTKEVWLPGLDSN